MYFLKLAVSIYRLGVFLSRVVAAQTVTPPNTPQCLLTCTSQYCPTADLQCECVDQLNNITVCVLLNCSASDQVTAAQIASEICASGILPTDVIANCQYL